MVLVALGRLQSVRVGFDRYLQVLGGACDLQVKPTGAVGYGRLAPASNLYR